MTLVDWIVIGFVASIAASTGVLFAGFAALAGFKKLREDPSLWVITPMGMKVTGFVVAAAGVLADVWFNWTRGAWIFREWPWSHGTLMFTHRVQWHLDNADQMRNKLVALRWARVGNAIAPGHFKRVPF
jgi:hypothetical protein